MIYHGTKQHLKQIKVHGHDLSHVFWNKTYHECTLEGGWNGGPFMHIHAMWLVLRPEDGENVVLWQIFEQTHLKATRSLVVVLFLHSREHLSACSTKSQCRRSPPKRSKQWAVSSVHQGSDIASNRNFPWTMQHVRSMLGLMYLSNSLLVKLRERR